MVDKDCWCREGSPCLLINIEGSECFRVDQDGKFFVQGVEISLPSQIELVQAAAKKYADYCKSLRDATIAMHRRHCCSDNNPG